MKCTIGDKIEVHYRGTLEDGGKEFDASYNRGQPLSFHVGKGQVIKGWDQGCEYCLSTDRGCFTNVIPVLDMCPGEKRTLTIQPEWAYGSRGMGPIPANSVLGMWYHEVKADEYTNKPQYSRLSWSALPASRRTSSRGLDNLQK